MAGAVALKDDKDLRWRKLYEHLQDMPYGSLVTYKELERILGANPFTNRFDIYRTSKELQRTSQRTMKNVRGQGYRIAEPKEHEGLALDRQRYARGHIRKAQAIIGATDRSALTPEEQARLTSLEVHMSRVGQALRKQGQQIERIEQRLDVDMEARLSRIERALRIDTDASD